MFQGLYAGAVGGGGNIEPEIPQEVGVSLGSGVLVVLPVEKTVVVFTAASQNEMLAVSVRRGEVAGVGIRVARERRDASVVALASDTRVVIYRPCAVVDVEEAVGVHRRSGRSKSHDIDLINLGGFIAVRVPGFYVECVVAGREGYPGINRWAEIAKDVYVVNIDHISGDGCCVLGGGLEMDGGDQVRRAVR